MKKLLLLMLMMLPIAFVSCGSGDDEPNYSNQTLTVGSVYKIPGGSTGWASDNELIASISTNGVTAEHVGETYIRNGSKSFKVTVTAKYNTFKEPYMQFGASMSTVKSAMSSYTLNRETSETLLYNGNFPITYYLFGFKNGGLDMSSVIIKAASVDSDELIEFMAERYVYVTKNDEKYYFGFITPDKKTIVVLQFDTLNSQVVYHIAYAAASLSNAPAQIMQMMRKQLAPASTEVTPEAKAEYSRLLDVMPAMQTEYNTFNK